MFEGSHHHLLQLLVNVYTLSEFPSVTIIIPSEAQIVPSLAK